MARVGIIGGMSWESTRLYYEIVNREVRERRGGLHSADVWIASLDFAQLAVLQRDGAWDRIAAILIEAARGLESAGAGAVAIAANTMHRCADTVQAAIGVPLLHVADPLVAALRADGRGRPLLLGTRFTMEEPFLRDRLIQAGLEPQIPDEPDRAAIHALIYGELCAGIVSPSGQNLLRVVVDLAAGADSVILGCTELGMLVDRPLARPTYDTTVLHARAIADFSIQDAILISK